MYPLKYVMIIRSKTLYKHFLLDIFILLIRVVNWWSLTEKYKINLINITAEKNPRNSKCIFQGSHFNFPRIEKKKIIIKNH